MEPPSTHCLVQEPGCWPFPYPLLTPYPHFSPKHLFSPILNYVTFRSPAPPPSRDNVPQPLISLLQSNCQEEIYLIMCLIMSLFCSETSGGSPLPSWWSWSPSVYRALLFSSYLQTFAHVVPIASNAFPCTVFLTNFYSSFKTQPQHSVTQETFIFPSYIPFLQKTYPPSLILT